MDFRYEGPSTGGVRLRLAHLPRTLRPSAINVSLMEPERSDIFARASM